MGPRGGAPSGGDPRLGSGRLRQDHRHLGLAGYLERKDLAWVGGDDGRLRVHEFLPSRFLPAKRAPTSALVAPSSQWVAMVSQLHSGIRVMSVTSAYRVSADASTVRSAGDAGPVAEVGDQPAAGWVLVGPVLGVELGARQWECFVGQVLQLGDVGAGEVDESVRRVLQVGGVRMPEDRVWASPAGKRCSPMSSTGWYPSSSRQPASNVGWASTSPSVESADPVEPCTERGAHELQSAAEAEHRRASRPDDVGQSDQVGRVVQIRCRPVATEEHRRDVELVDDAGITMPTRSRARATPARAWPPPSR